MSRTDTIQKLTYDDFSHIIGNDRSGTASDIVMTVRGRKQPRESVLLEKDSTDYIGNLILRNGKPQMYRFSGGYYSFDDDGVLGDAHFYIQDYQGNNRMVVNAYQESHGLSLQGRTIPVNVGGDNPFIKHKMNNFTNIWRP